MIGSFHSPSCLQGKERTLTSLSRHRARSSTPLWLRRCALGMSGVFAWSVLAAIPAQALAHPAPAVRREGVRVLRPAEMRQMVGQQVMGGPPMDGHPISLSPDAGSTYPWEGNAGDVNTGNGNKLTRLPLVAWTQRGGLPVSLTLAHNSQSTHNGELGNKWTFSYDIYLAAPTGFSPAGPGSLAVHWGEDQSYVFNCSGSTFTPPAGIYDTLVQNVDGTYTLTKKDQTSYHFNTALYCDSITDENGNSTTISHNTGGFVTSVADTTGRTLTLGYDTSNRISTVTDPLGRVWTMGYDASNNLTGISLPVLSGTAYTYSLGYDANHNITSMTSPGSRASAFTYNSADSSIASQTDGAGKTSTYAYTASATTITDANSHALTYNYASGRLSGTLDAQNHSVTEAYDAANNKTSITEARSKTTTLTYDTQGNILTSTDPLGNVTTYTYNSHSKPLTKVLPTGEEVVYTYDAQDNVTVTATLDNGGTTRASEGCTYNAHGLLTDCGDPNGHHTQYGYDVDGNLTSVTTPNGHMTAWTVNGLGVKTGRTDGLSRATTYTLDAWERVTGISYPSSLQNKAFTYDADDNLTQFVDATGTTNRNYDADGRLLSESKGGTTVVSHTYDATGKAGQLSTTADANGRVITYSYDSLNHLASVSETVGTTSYTYDAAGHETGIVNANGTTVAKTYDDDGQLTSVVNKNGAGTTLSSFSYVYDTDSRRHTCTEVNGDMVTYGYDYVGRLTSEGRTGSSAYSLSYTLDAAGNRLSQTKGTATTAFTLDSDDELTATTSSTGGFVNTYGYNANGEQTSRTLSGTAYTLAYDYEGQITGITQGAGTTAFTYDAGGRRMSRTAGGTATQFVYDGASVLLEKQGASTTATYTYGNSLVRKDGETPLFDGQGGERTVTNATQAVSGTLTQDGFGNTVASTGSSSSPYMYAATSGYRNDGDAGLSKAGCRYYDAQTGTFTSRDTFLDQKPYLYCEHDPINCLDPSGHDLVTITVDGPGGKTTITVDAPPGTTVTVQGPGGPITITVPAAPDKGKGKGKKKPPISGSVTGGQDVNGNGTGTASVTSGNVTTGITLTNHKKPVWTVKYTY